MPNNPPNRAETASKNSGSKLWLPDSKAGPTALAVDPANDCSLSHVIDFCRGLKPEICTPWRSESTPTPCKFVDRLYEEGMSAEPPDEPDYYADITIQTHVPRELMDWGKDSNFHGLGEQNRRR